MKISHICTRSMFNSFKISIAIHRLIFSGGVSVHDYWFWGVNNFCSGDGEIQESVVWLRNQWPNCLARAIFTALPTWGALNIKVFQHVQKTCPMFLFKPIVMHDSWQALLTTQVLWTDQTGFSLISACSGKYHRPGARLIIRHVLVYRKNKLKIFPINLFQGRAKNQKGGGGFRPH